MQQSPRAEKQPAAKKPFSKRNITNTELYKTLRIDLNEAAPKTTAALRPDSRNPPAQTKPSLKPKYPVTSQTFYMQTLSQLQIGRKKQAVGQGSVTDRAKRAEEVLAFTRMKKPKGANLSSVVEHDLVERVMDSLKILSRREEEAKAVKVPPKKAATDSDPQQNRRRTNTFHQTTNVVPLLDRST